LPEEDAELGDERDPDMDDVFTLATGHQYPRRRHRDK
jgi:hypothetical protein